MRWRAQAVAVAGLSAWLAGCDFSGAWTQYCGHPGRCASIDGGGPPAQIAQGTNALPVFITGGGLAGAQVEVLPPGAGSVSGLVATDQRIDLALTVAHGLDAGSLVSLLVTWEADRPFDAQDAGSAVVTPIVVSPDGGDGRAGTYDAPYLTLARASAHSSAGDTILLRPGTYRSIFSDAGTPCSDVDAGLKGGVTVAGDPSAPPTIAGTGAPNACAFNLWRNDQALQSLIVTGFSECVRAGDTGYDGGNGGARPRLKDVKLQGCDVGLSAAPGSSALLQNVTIENAADRGLVVNGANVDFQGGAVRASANAGVQVEGNGGALALWHVDVSSNGVNNDTSFTLGAGLLVDADGGFVVMDGGFLNSNGHTGLTVAGSGNTAALDGVGVQTSLGGGMSVAALAGSGGNLFLANTRLFGSFTCLYVEDFAVLNGGRGDGGWGNNSLECTAHPWPTGINVHDARAGAAPGAHPPIFFSRTTLDGGTPAGLRVTSTNPLFGIQIDNAGNEVDFE